MERESVPHEHVQEVRDLVDPWSEPVLPVRRELRTWLDRFGPADSAGHLLE